MAEETTQVQEAAQAAPDLSSQARERLFGMFAPEGQPQNNGEPQQQAQQQQQNPTPEPKQEPAPTEEELEEILEPSAWLKNRYGFDSEEALENELKTLREKAGKVFEYKNDDSKKIAEYINEGKLEDLYSFLDTQMKVKKLSSSELSNKSTAAELVKFGIKNDNKAANLTDDEVDFIFNQKYAIPSEPVQTDTEADEDFALRHSAWKTQVSNIEKGLIIEAKMQQPKLSALLTELVLPDINPNKNQAPAITPEQQAAFEKQLNSFSETSNKLLNDFKGYSANVKNKDVDYNVSYDLSKEEKEVIGNEIQKFVQSGLDANSLLAQRWVNEDMTPNTDQIVKDLLKIYSDDSRVMNTLVNKAANQRLELFLKEKKNINVNETRQEGILQPQEKSQSDLAREKLFGMVAG